MISCVLSGPTASGKSSLAIRLAKANGFEIICADSRQIYQGMELGTNAPNADEKVIPHHLLGFLNPTEHYSPRTFARDVHILLGKNPQTNFLLVGGTGLYIKELLFPSPFDRGATPDNIRLEAKAKLNEQGLSFWHGELVKVDPEGMRKVHPNDTYRILQRLENQLMQAGTSYTDFTGPALPDPRFENTGIIALEMDRQKLYDRIDARVETMVQAGWMNEVKSLMEIPNWENLPAYNSLGYGELTLVLQKKIELSEAIGKIRKRTRNYAKRQNTFFRKQLPKVQLWDPAPLEATLEACQWDWNRFLEQHPDAKNPNPSPQNPIENKDDAD